MSNYIEQALSGLTQALDNLERAAAVQEQKILKIRQQELFNGNANGGKNGYNIGVDPALLAQRLDVAIEKVEKVLAEA